MNSKLVKAPTNTEFIAALKQGRDGIELAAKILVYLVDRNDKTFEELVKADPSISYNLLGNLERVGRGQIYAALLFDSSPGARKLLTLPTSQQKKLYDEPVKIVRVVDGKNIVEEKPIQQLSRHEANLLVDDAGHARTVEEQIKHISTPPTPSSKRAARYEIIGDRLRVLADTEFSMSNLEDILKRMKQKAIESLATKK